MITLGDVVMILDLHRQGLSVSAIARELGIDRKTVRKYIARGLEPPVYGPRQAWLTLPSCFASSSTPTLLRMIFSSLVIVSSPRSDTQCLPSETTPPPS